MTISKKNKLKTIKLVDYKRLLDTPNAQNSFTQAQEIPLPDSQNEFTSEFFIVYLYRNLQDTSLIQEERDFNIAWCLGRLKLLKYFDE